MSSTRSAQALQPRATAAPPEAPRAALSLAPPAGAVDGRAGVPAISPARTAPAAAPATSPAQTAPAAAAYAGGARLQAATARQLRLLATELAGDATDLHARARAAHHADQQQRAAITGIGVSILALLRTTTGAR